jgi:transposase
MSKTGIPIIRENAAGIDIGAENMHVSVDGDKVKVFPTFTESLVELVKYLQSSNVQSVAMEATGVLWLPLHDLIEDVGIEIYLVNGLQAKNIGDHKTDSRDSRWLQRIHSCGLLRASFVPKDSIRELRTYMRQRENHIDSSSTCVQRMQRSFELMNIKLHNVISDIKGVSGIKIIEAILAGERDAKKMAKLCDTRILNKKKAQVIASLVGNYKSEYLFLLEQSYAEYNFFQNQILECDRRIECLLSEITKQLPDPPDSDPKPSRHNHPQIENLHKQIVQLNGGMNASILPGCTDKTILKLISELGTDLGRWPTPKHFVSYLGLSPRMNQSGKLNRKGKWKIKTVAGQIFRESALSIANSKYLSMKGFYNRLKSKHGHKVAIKATARKLAVQYYLFMTKGLEYVEKGLAEYENLYRESTIRRLQKKASNFGMMLVTV